MDTPIKEQKIHIERDRTGLYGLYIGNVAPEINENDLRGLFISSGFIEVCKILKHNEKTMHVAFVKFARYEEAVSGMQKVNGTMFGGHILEVRPAYETHRRPHRFDKGKSPSSESLSKQGGKNQGATNTAVNGNISEESIEKTKVNDVGRNGGKKLDSLPQKENPAKSLDEKKSNAYMLPPASQDVRYCKGNGSTCSTSSLESFCDKSPVLSSTFKPQANIHQQMGIDADLDGLNKNYNSHSAHSGQAKVKAEAIHATTSVNNNNLSGSMQLTQNMGKMHVGGKYHNGQFSQRNACISKWSVEQVAEFFQRQEECTESMVTFIKEQEIDGNALMLIEEYSLLHFMKLGPALKFLNLREKLKN